MISDRLLFFGMSFVIAVFRLSEFIYLLFKALNFMDSLLQLGL